MPIVRSSLCPRSTTVPPPTPRSSCRSPRIIRCMKVGRGGYLDGQSELLRDPNPAPELFVVQAELLPRVIVRVGRAYIDDRARRISNRSQVLARDLADHVDAR